ARLQTSQLALCDTSVSWLGPVPLSWNVSSHFGGAGLLRPEPICWMSLVSTARQSVASVRCAPRVGSLSAKNVHSVQTIGGFPTQSGPRANRDYHARYANTKRHPQEGEGVAKT